MTIEQLRQQIDELRAHPRGETEWIEFKHNKAIAEEIGGYISAIANSSALHRKSAGYIVWGIKDETLNVIGTSFKPHQQKVGNEELENWLLRGLTPRIEIKIYEFNYRPSVPVVIFEIQPASHMPVRFNGEEHIRVGSYKKKLKDFPAKERELWKILSEKPRDWSAEICQDASISDLAPEAIQFARLQYKKKHMREEIPHLEQEIDDWEDLTFLNKAKVCINSKITNTAILLLGKPETIHYLSSPSPMITWILRDEEGNEQDYEHFSPPLILAVDNIFSKIRNLTYRYMPDGSLFPLEITKYDSWIIRELLHNCIAHREYLKAGRINVIEKPDSLIFSNPGSFLPGSVEAVILRDAPFDEYRNAFLAQAMVNLNMIDTIGSGIKRMFRRQRKRYFPMPDYDLTLPDIVKVELPGKVLDENYTRVLLEKAELDLMDVIALDKVQKGRTKELTEQEFKSLKSQGFIEGRRPNLYISAKVAKLTGQEPDYIKLKGFDKEKCKETLIAYLEEFGSAKREKIDSLLLDYLSDALTHNQKMNQIKNLLQSMRKAGIIERVGSKRYGEWRLSKDRVDDDNP